MDPILIILASGTIGLVLVVVAVVCALRVVGGRRGGEIACVLERTPRTSLTLTHAPVLSAAGVKGVDSPPAAAAAANMLGWLQARGLTKVPGHEELRPVDLAGRRVAWESTVDGWCLCLSPTALVLRAADPLGNHWAVKLYLDMVPERQAHFRGLRDCLRRLDPWLRRRLAEPEEELVVFRPHRGDERARAHLLLTRWVDGDLLHEFLARRRNTPYDRQDILEVARKFRELCAHFRRAGFCHGDLCPRNVVVIQKSLRFELKLLDLDSFGQAPEMLRHVRGEKGFQNPARVEAPDKFAAAPLTVDVPSELLVYLSLLAYAADTSGAIPLDPEGQSLAFREEELLAPASSGAAACLAQALTNPIDSQLSGTLIGALGDAFRPTTAPETMRPTELIAPVDQLMRLEANLRVAIAAGA